MNRRTFLKSALTTGALAGIAHSGFLAPNLAFAQEDDFKLASDKIGNNIANAKPGDFKFKVPNLAENGAVVPMTVDASKMQGVNQIAIYIKNNATPLAALFKLTSDSAGFVSTRAKMAETSDVVALVTANNQNYAVTKKINVTIGGCGG